MKESTREAAVGVANLAKTLAPELWHLNRNIICQRVRELTPLAMRRFQVCGNHTFRQWVKGMAVDACLMEVDEIKLRNRRV